jgi:ribosomal protein S18 acetylase RimI-like enzyme
MSLHELTSRDQTEPFSADDVIDFLYNHLDEFGDERDAIEKCLNYVFNRGGFVIVAIEDDKVVGATIINDTGMEGYIPEHILVYIAVHGDYRGRGLGKQIMQAALDKCTGDIALHVEADNPAVHLYKKIGFTNKYLEMRLHRSSN